MQRSVIVVGGGLAGLASACALAERGVLVTLLEARPVLGGRASSFVDSETGETLDNCQHVAMGCCTNFLHFCRTLGVDHLLERIDELYFIDGGGVMSTFRPSRWLPAPLHLLPALRRLKFLSRGDRREIARGLKLLARLRTPAPLPQVSASFLNELRMTREQLDDDRQSRRDDWSFEQFLDLANQGPTARDKFWKVVLVSALSEELSHITLRYAAKVFVDGFLAHRDGWTIFRPRVPLGELYGANLENWLTARGATLRRNSAVRELVTDADGLVRSVVLRSGESLSADACVLAVPWHRVLDLLPPELKLTYHFLEEIASAPISSVHLWFDRPITELPHAVFVEHLSQWMFHRAAPSTEGGAPSPGHYYQVVISSSRGLSETPRDEILAAVCEELRTAFPAARGAVLLRGRLVTEHRAVFSPRPGIDRLRPPQETPSENLFLAGDWTDTDWPATMEGAVRSGYLAAECLLESFGQPAAIVQPNLPVARLSRWLFGV